jgi:hypothetical protein
MWPFAPPAATAQDWPNLHLKAAPEAGIRTRIIVVADLAALYGGSLSFGGAPICGLRAGIGAPRDLTVLITAAGHNY